MINVRAVMRRQDVEANMRDLVKMLAAVEGKLDHRTTVIGSKMLARLCFKTVKELETFKALAKLKNLEIESWIICEKNCPAENSLPDCDSGCGFAVARDSAENVCR